MKKNALALSVALILAACFPVAAWAAAEAAPQEAPQVPEASGEVIPEGPETPDAADTVDLLKLNHESALGLTPDADAQSCQDVCGTYHAPTQSDCTDVGCYNTGCGAPNRWDSSTCTCYCSYCF